MSEGIPPSRSKHMHASVPRMRLYGAQVMVVGSTC